MIPGWQKRRGNPDAYGATPAAAPPRQPARAMRYRLLLTRLPGTWELIVFDRVRTCVMRRIRGPVVEILRASGALPRELTREGACNADKELVMHLFLAGAAISCALEQVRSGQPQQAAGGAQQAAARRTAAGSAASP